MDQLRKAVKTSSGIITIDLYGANKDIVEWAKNSPLAFDTLHKIDDWEDNLFLALGKNLGDPERISAALEFSEKVWKLDPSIGPYYSLANLLKQFQHERIFYQEYRDHIAHQLKVFLLGLMIYDNCGRIRNAINDEIGYQPDSKEFFRRWTVAALFHDIGYLLENEGAYPPNGYSWNIVKNEISEIMKSPLTAALGWQDYSERSLVRNAVLADRDLASVQTLGKFGNKDLYHQLNTAADFSGLTREIDIGNNTVCAIKNYYEFAFDYGTLQGRDRFRDHGIASALILQQIWYAFKTRVEDIINFVSEIKTETEGPLLTNKERKQLNELYSVLHERENTITAAAMAIALHNIEKDIFDEAEAYLSHIDLRNFQICLDDNSGNSEQNTQPTPLAFLLALCDTIQIWDRGKFKAHTHTDPIRTIDQQISFRVTDKTIGLWLGSHHNIADRNNDPAKLFESIKDECKKKLSNVTVDELFLLLNDDCLRPAPTAPPDPEPPKIGATIGRSGLVDELLTAVQNRQSIILTGEPGIGKSTVHSAVYYHLKRKINPVGQTICYYRLIEEGTLKDRLAKIQSEIYDSIKPSSGGESKSPQDIVKYIKSYTAKYRLYFFIDNVDDDCSVRSLVEMYHDCPQIIYVVTSRCNVWDMAKMIEVIGLASEDGYELIKKAYETGRHIKFDDLLEKEYRSIETSISFDNFKINKRIELMQLSDKVMGHPMILEDFGAKLRLERFTTDKLVGEYQTVDVAKMLDDKYEKIEKMIFNKLPEIAHECFFIIGLLDTSDISCEIAQYIGNINEKILKVLDDYFLIRLSPSEHYFSVHQTFRTWCRHKYIKHGDVAKINHSIIKLGELYLNKAAQKQFPIEVIRKEWPNILKIIDSSVNAEISLKILDLAIGDNYDDPNGYIPQKSLMGIILQDSRIEKLQNDLSEITDHLLKAKIQKNIGHFYYWRGEYNIAEKFFLEAKSNYEMASSNNSDNFQSALEGIAATTSLLGYIADDENRFTEAENYYKTGKKKAELVEPKNLKLIANGHHLIGCTYYHQGKYTEAETEFSRAKYFLRLSGETTDHLLSRIMKRLSSVAYRLNDLEAAVRFLKEAEALVIRIQRPRDAARIARYWARIFLSQNEIGKAEEKLNQAMDGYNQLEDKRGRGNTLRSLACLERIKGNDLHKAMVFCDESLKIAKEVKSLYGQAAAFEEKAAILEKMNEDINLVNREYYRARNIYKIIQHSKERILNKKLEAASYFSRFLRNPAKIKGIVFDLMDTLVYMAPEAYTNTQIKIASQAGIDVVLFQKYWNESRKEASIHPLSTYDRIAYVFKECKIEIGDAKLNRLSEIVNDMWGRDDVVKLYPQTTKLLETLRSNGLKTAILSNGPKAMENIIPHLKLDRYIDEHLLSYNAGCVKPDEIIYKKISRRLDLAPGECLFIGDGNDEELDGAKKAGMVPIKIHNTNRPGYANIGNESLDWDYEVDNLDALNAFFRKSGLLDAQS